MTNTDLGIIISNIIEANTDSVLGEDGMIVVDYAQLRDALVKSIQQAIDQAVKEGDKEDKK